MATQAQVRRYLAYWFQLGKPVVIGNRQEKVLPEPIMSHGAYSSEFEVLWNRVSNPETGDCYLDGTDMTIQELLTSNWEIHPCARCDMPVPMISQGLPCLSCPCNDLLSWPNTEMPQPRSAVDTQKQLNNLCDRLNVASEKPPADLKKIHHH